MIELRNVSITSGSFQLENISFRVRAGEHAVLMGQTGRGKTTILEAVCGLRTITKGKLVVHGHDMTDWLPGDREIGYVPQDLALFPTLTVKQHLEFALRLRKYESKQIAVRVKELAEELGISPLLSRSVRGLSGGESQRVALGRAMSFRPQVLLLDEPFSALDEETRAEILTLLKNMTTAAGVTTLHVTHNTLDASRLASRRLLLKDGVVHDETGTEDE